MKKLRYAFEALCLYLLFGLFKLLPPQTASETGGWITRTLGPRMAVSRKALANIRRALPGLSAEEEQRILRGMWDNLGRVIAEYPHLETISRDRTVFEGHSDFDSFFAADEPAVFISAHLSNWEIHGAALLTQFGKKVELTYRAPNNPWSARLLHRARTLGGRIPAHPKTRESGKALLEALRAGRYLGFLIDQKYNEGVSVPFFGIEAMTNPVFIKMAQRYKCPVIPVQNIRLDGARFRLKFYEPLRLFGEDGAPLPVEDVLAEAHAVLEGWIREHPEQWLWLHRRWPSDNDKKKEDEES
ncbi:MAG: lipid A biosynthesis acyltransferase [Alphaproteobacteria bacterium]